MVYLIGNKLLADNLRELHFFAAKVRLPKRYFYGGSKKEPFYFVRNEEKDRMRRWGALIVTARDMIEKEGMVDHTEYLRKINQEYE